ncbi:protein FAM200C-like [Biomphalaria glabrata]|uniref:Protein FAM200C-like n=1 Tax=Biomphalaria glabrata TaxID=6526 RepID=A0A9W3APY2_BIOGL|nr:protein FAM200C-like [Biomphalaria glabrata]
MDQEIHEELLFAKTLAIDTKGESILKVLKDYFKEKEIPLGNIILVATDGAPAMVGRYRGFVSLLKENVPGVLAIHCVIHRQHLVAKNLSVRLHESLQFVITAVNRIRANALNTRLFAQLCEENDENFHQLLLHTDSMVVERFENILNMEIPQWIIDPYVDMIEEDDVALQEELLGISTNEELKVQLKKRISALLVPKDIPDTYTILWNIVRKFLIAFPSSYLVDRGFSTVNNLLLNTRNKLDITN